MNIKEYLKRSIRFIIKGPPIIYNNCSANIVETSPSELLKGKNIIVTGGSRGLGYSMAKKFVQEGANVLITGKNIRSLEQTAKELNCRFLQIDLQIKNEFAKFIKEANQLLGGIDILVNNAGVSLHEEDFRAVTMDSFDTQINVNLRAPFFLAQAFVNLLENGGKSGVILFVSSETGQTVDERPYGWSKAAINSMVQGLAYKLAGEGFRINAIAPGITASDMTGIKAEGNLYYPNNIINRVYLASEVAEIACFLVSDLAAAINGQIINTNNGKTINARWK